MIWRRITRTNDGTGCSYNTIITLAVGLLFHSWYPYVINCCAVTLPLWKPSRIELGAVGFLSKPEGRFETLFNAFNPGETSGGKADELPTLSGYGKAVQGNQRQDKRNAAQRGFDRVQGLFSSEYVLFTPTLSTINGTDFLVP